MVFVLTQAALPVLYFLKFLIMTQHISHHRLVSELQNIVKNDPHSIQGAVAKEALTHESPTDFFKDLLHHGCISGMVGSLIYYRDTQKFYDTHYDEIEDLRHNMEYAESGFIDGDLKNTYAWLSFEETAYRMAVNLELKG